MSNNNHVSFVPYRFVIEQSDAEREPSAQTTIRAAYNPANFQHLSLIARMFSRTFVNHSAADDSLGLASVIEALPGITFTLRDRQTRLQFAAEADTLTMDAPPVDLRAFIDAAPSGIQIAWKETLMWRRDADGKISERWQVPHAAQVQAYGVAC